MEWIKEIRASLRMLDLSPERLRSFGLVLGSILAGLSGWLIMKIPAAGGVYALASASVLLLVAGLFFPKRLAAPYKLWMGLAFTMGHVMSRLLLTAVFFLVVTPIGGVARLMGRHFLDLRDRDRTTTCWVPRTPGRKPNYEKLY